MCNRVFTSIQGLSEHKALAHSKKSAEYSAKRSKVAKANWQNEEYRKRQSDKAKIYWSKQENHEKASKIQKEANKDPVVKARRSAAQKKFLADHERRELRRQKQLATKRAHNKDGSLSRSYAKANHRRWENWTDEQKDAWLQKKLELVGQAMVDHRVSILKNRT